MTVLDYQTVIVGAGFSGICAAIKLDKAGLGDYLVRQRVHSQGTCLASIYGHVNFDLVPERRVSDRRTRAAMGAAPRRDHLGTRLWRGPSTTPRSSS
jgi:succinate dehydrogenase/fumarate reductase flavoprotein subunit